MTKNNINEMIEVSLKKEKLLNEFYSLTRSQMEFLKLEDFEKLEKLLVDKSNLMERINKLDGKFLDKFEKIKQLENIDSIEEIDSNKYKNLKQLKDIITKLSQRLKEIYELDNENTKLISKNLDGVKFELRNVKNSQIAYKGYNIEQSGSMMIDERK